MKLFDLNDITYAEQVNVQAYKIDLWLAPPWHEMSRGNDQRVWISFCIDKNVSELNISVYFISVNKISILKRRVKCKLVPEFPCLKNPYTNVEQDWMHVGMCTLFVNHTLRNLQLMLTCIRLLMFYVCSIRVNPHQSSKFISCFRKHP